MQLLDYAPRVLRHALIVLCLVGHAATAAADKGAPEAPAPTTAEPSPGVVNLNTATAEELDRLPGVGPTRAAAILQLRTQRGRFEKVEDILRVKGIGRATFRKLRPMLTLAGPTTLLAQPSRAGK